MAKSTKPANKKSVSKKKPATENVEVSDGIHPAARPFLWLGSHGVQKNFMWVIGLLMVISVAMNFIKKPYGHFEWETWIGGYALFGFLAFTFAVLMGWPLRKLTGRSEDYYQDGESDD